MRAATCPTPRLGLSPASFTRKSILPRYRGRSSDCSRFLWAARPLGRSIGLIGAPACCRAHASRRAPPAPARRGIAMHGVYAILYAVDTRPGHLVFLSSPHGPPLATDFSRTAATLHKYMASRLHSSHQPGKTLVVTSTRLDNSATPTASSSQLRRVSWAPAPRPFRRRRFQTWSGRSPSYRSASSPPRWHQARLHSPPFDRRRDGGLPRAIGYIR
jgi:hypothetical protein